MQNPASNAPQLDDLDEEERRLREEERLLEEEEKLLTAQGV